MSSTQAPRIRPIERLLFVCVANSARSQIAEALARHELGDRFQVQSAGSAPTRVNPLAIQVLEELGVSTQGLASKAIASIDPDSVDCVVRLCAEEECPVFPGGVPQVGWEQPDPDRKHEDLSDAERLAHFRVARDAIHTRVLELAQTGLLARFHGENSAALFFASGVVASDSGATRVNLAIAEETTALLERCAEQVGCRRPTGLMVIINQVQLVEKSARAHFADPGKLPSYDRIALIAPNPLARMVGSFFVRLNRPVLPSRVFDDRQAAEAWLLAPEP